MSGGGDNKVEDTPQMRYLAEVAADTWNFTQEELKPLQTAYMEKVDSMSDPARKEYVAGKANLGQQGVMSEATEQVAEAASARGLDLNSGKVKSGLTDIAIGAAESGGQVSAQGQFSQDSEHIKGLQSVVDIGSGQQSQAVAGLSDVATVAGQNARADAVDKFNRRSANLQTVGTIIGAGARYGMQPSAPVTNGGYAGSKGNMADGNAKSIGW